MLSGSKVCDTPKRINCYAVSGIVVGSFALAAGCGLTLFVGNRVSTKIENTLNNFITNLFNKTITIPTPEFDVAVPSVNLPINITGEFLVQIFKSFLNDRGARIVDRLLGHVDRNFTINIQTPSDLSIPVESKNVSFSLLNVIGASLDTITDGITEASEDINLAFIVIGFLFSLLIATTIMHSFFLLAKAPRHHEHQPRVLT